MTLAVIQPVDWVSIVHCEACGQSMPADHETHINSGAGPVAPEPAPDPHEGDHS